MNTKQAFFAVNRMSRLPTAGKLTTLGRPHALLRSSILAPLLVACSLAFYVVPASAEETCSNCKPAWQVTVDGFPTVQPESIGRKGRYDIVVEIGAQTSTGEVTVEDVLPPGLSARAATARPGGNCEPESGPEVVCRFASETVPSGFMVIKIEYEVTGALVSPLRTLRRLVVVEWEGRRPRRQSRVSGVSGPPFGVAQFGFQATGPAG